MNSKLDTLKVALGERSYPIYIGHGLLNEAHLIEKHIASRQVMIVTNETIEPLYLQQCIKQFSNGFDVNAVVLPDGERYKTLTYLNKIFDSLLENKCNRQVTLIALGGGGYINPAIRKYALKKCITVWLDWKNETLIKRIKNSKKRPLAIKLSSLELQKLIIERSTMYNLSDYKINCDKLVKRQIVKKIINFYENS